VFFKIEHRELVWTMFSVKKMSRYVHMSNNEKKIEIKCDKAVLRIVKDKEEQ
jgi:hypothetical protein